MMFRELLEMLGVIKAKPLYAIDMEHCTITSIDVRYLGFMIPMLKGRKYKIREMTPEELAADQ